MFTAADLFNCCPDSFGPEWRNFTSLEIGACREIDGCIEFGVPDADATFWTVYGRLLPDDIGFSLSEAITDCPMKARALEIAAELSRISGLPIAKDDPTKPVMQLIHAAEGALMRGNWTLAEQIQMELQGSRMTGAPFGAEIVAGLIESERVAVANRQRNAA